jgi:uncharacterized protein (DUF885 family)/cyclophilin family peptidyl-prolyl cis-trans isomerase
MPVADDMLVRLSTAAGDIVIRLEPDKAANTVAAFLDWLDSGRISGLRFARVVRAENDRSAPPIAVIQTMPEKYRPAPVIEHESTAQSGLRHCDGAVSLARGPAGETTPEAFFICIGDQPALDHGGTRNSDGLGFAVFGVVVDGMDVVRTIHKGATRPDAPTPYLEDQILAVPVDIFVARREPATQAMRLQRLAEDYWRFFLREFPAEAAVAGAPPTDQRLGDARIDSLQRRNAQARALLERARDIDGTDLTREDAVTAELLVNLLTTIHDAWAAGDHLTTKLYPFGFTEIPAFLIGGAAISTSADEETLIARLNAIPDYFAGHVQTMKYAQHLGYRLPRVLLARVRGLVEAQLAAGGIADVVRARIDLNHNPEAAAALNNAALPALHNVLSYLHENEDALCRDTISVRDQPNGDAYYLFRVRQQTTTDLHPDEIHALGLEDVASLRADLDGMLADAGAQCTASTYLAHLARTSIAADAASLLQRTRSVAKTIDGKLPLLFGRLPRITYAVEGFSPAQSLQRPVAMAQPSPADRRLPGIFWITALPERCPTHMLVSLCLHEAWPGHLMQFALAHENVELPAFRRHASFDFNAYIEGWALYCERLGYEVGLYDDPHDRIGQMTNDLWRAARLVVDTGIHWKLWSRTEAIDYLVANAFLPRETAEAEVDRYIGMPAQALSYKIGERTIRALRKEAETQLGDAFCVRRFHDAVLETGAVSLTVLQKHIRHWITSTSEGI